MGAPPRTASLAIIWARWRGSRRAGSTVLPGTPQTSARCRSTRGSALTATNVGGGRATSATSGPTGAGTWAST
eukprot:295186-Lingulodinium_polyedra.AAC.1